MISIIIPVLNERENIGKLIMQLKQAAQQLTIEIIVVDGGSTDDTVEIANKAGVIVLISPAKGRAAQMNYGAKQAKGSIFYFVHADVLPPADCFPAIMEATKAGYGFGRFRTRFESNRLLLRLNAFFTRFDLFVCYGGDQTLFITRNLFEQIGGFQQQFRIMEDYEIVERAKKQARYKIIQKDVLVSTRKYLTNSWFKVQRANYTIVKMYKNGAAQEAMIKKYKEMLNYR